MNAARRSHKRRDWPPNLYEPRPGYYVWRDPRTHQSFALGYIPFTAARHEALQANAHIEATKPTLLQRLTGATNTIAGLLDDMPAPANKNTAKATRSLDKRIREAHGHIACMDLTVVHCADLITGNCRIVCAAINIALNEFGEAVFRKLAHALYKPSFELMVNAKSSHEEASSAAHADEQNG